MEIWYYWLIASIIFFGLEIITSGFAVICFSFGSLCAAITTIFTDSFNIQAIVFAISSIIFFLFIRPIIMKYFYNNKKKQFKTNASAMVGKIGKVDTKITSNSGRVVIDGDNWKAVSEDETEIEKGQRVIVTKIDSIIITVKKLNK